MHEQRTPKDDSQLSTVAMPYLLHRVTILVLVCPGDNETI